MSRYVTRKRMWFGLGTLTAVALMAGTLLVGGAEPADAGLATYYDYFKQSGWGCDYSWQVGGKVPVCDENCSVIYYHTWGQVTSCVKTSQGPCLF